MEKQPELTNVITQSGCEIYISKLLTIILAPIISVNNKC